MGERLTVETVNEVRAFLSIGATEPVTLRELERFCETLRAAGADGEQPVGVAANGASRVTLTSVVKLPRLSRANGPS